MAAARALLGDPASASAELKEGAAVTVAGRIEAAEPLAGTGAAALEVAYRAEIRGSATEREVLAQARASMLVLVTGEERWPIVGPIEIVAGSRVAISIRRAEQIPAPLTHDIEAWKHYLG